MRSLCLPLLAVAAGALAFAGAGSPARADDPAPASACPAEMLRVQGFCIDRWEIATVDQATQNPLSPYYPPEPNQLAEVHAYWSVHRLRYGDAAARALPLPELPAWQRDHTFAPRAVSRPGVVPQGYLSYHSAKRSCENAGKRLCTKDEWVAACRGRGDTKFPYGADYRAGRCNVYRQMHPAAVLHASSSLGHRDPRLNLVDEGGKDPLLRLSGATGSCASDFDGGKLYDMVGNLDEWVESDPPEFVGGFYARMSTLGCEAKVSSHAAIYYDYSTGTRCCRSP